MRSSYFPIDRLTSLQALRVSAASCAAWLELCVASGCIASGALGCATVTQEEPPSNQTGAQGGSGAGGVGQGGSANGGSNSSLGGSSSSLGGSPGNGGSGVNLGGSGGSGGSPQGGTGGNSPVFMPPLSVDAGLPPGMIVFEDDFEALSPDWFTSPNSVWTITTDPGATGNVYSQSATADSNDGFLATAGSVAMTDYILQGDFKVVSFGGQSSGYMAGLCVRVADATNFYMVGVRSNNDFPLQLRRFGEGETILADADIELAVGVWYRLRVDVTGSNITAYLNGELMFTFADMGLPAGGFGLCTANASAMFDNIIVTQPL